MRVSFILSFLFFCSSILFSQESDSLLQKNYINGEVEFIYDGRTVIPRGTISIYQREAFIYKKFSIDFLIGTGISGKEYYDFFFSPAAKTGIQVAYKINNRHRIYIGAGNLFVLLSNIYGKVRAGYSFKITDRLFFSVSYENFFWTYYFRYYDYYIDEDGVEYEESHSEYNIWEWDFKSSSISFGVGINF